MSFALTPDAIRQTTADGIHLGRALRDLMTGDRADEDRHLRDLIAVAEGSYLARHATPGAFLAAFTIAAGIEAQMGGGPITLELWSADGSRQEDNPPEPIDLAMAVIAAASHGDTNGAFDVWSLADQVTQAGCGLVLIEVLRLMIEQDAS